MSSSITKEQVASTVVQEWVNNYLAEYLGSQRTNELPSAENLPEEFVQRLHARFSELDLAPRDGIVTLFEVDRAIANPLLHFDEKDIQMLKLLKRYFLKVSELHDDQPGQADHGISRADVSVLANCVSSSVERLRSRLEEEFRSRN